MKRSTDAARLLSEQARAWVVDYSAARERAVKWLGDRYLLARPINGRTSPRKHTEEA